MLVAQAPPAPVVPEEACGADPSWICDVTFRATESETFAKTVDFLVARPVKILLVLLLAWVANRLMRRAVRRFVAGVAEGAVRRGFEGLRQRAPDILAATSEVNLRSAQRTETIATVMRSIGTAVIWTIAMLTILAELGINLGPLIAGAGIVGVALGFGSQSLVRDFLSGMFMLIEDQFGVGDVIDAGEASGVVEGISLRTTRLRDVEGVVWHIPNGEIRRVGNQSQDWSRALLDVQVAHGTDLDRAQAVIKRVADELWNESEWSTVILAEPEVWGVEQLAAAGITIRLVVKTKPADQWKVQRTLRRRINDAFTAAGIQVPGVQLPTPPVPGPNPGS
jgi:moderate conductance mechanosensitive channel